MSRVAKATRKIQRPDNLVHDGSHKGKTLIVGTHKKRYRGLGNVLVKKVKCNVTHSALDGTWIVFTSSVYVW